MSSFDISAADNYNLAGDDGDAGDDGSPWQGGIGSMAVAGSAHTGTTKLQCNIAEAGWVDVGSDVEFTEDGVGNFELPPCYIRVNTEGGTDLNAAVGEVKKT